MFVLVKLTYIPIGLLNPSDDYPQIVQEHEQQNLPNYQQKRNLQGQGLNQSKTNETPITLGLLVH